VVRARAGLHEPIVPTDLPPSAGDKEALSSCGWPNFAIVSAYNEHDVAHQPLSRFRA